MLIPVLLAATIALHAGGPATALHAGGPPPAAARALRRSVALPRSCDRVLAWRVPSTKRCATPVCTTGNRAPLRLVSQCFPVLTIAAASLGLAFSGSCAALGSARSFSVGLSLLIFSMGLTLTPADLSRATRALRPLACNLACCFALTPLVAIGIASALPLELRPGIVLLGCVSGGQASNRERHAPQPRAGPASSRPSGGTAPTRPRAK